jgi:hypothetical protein
MSVFHRHHWHSSSRLPRVVPEGLARRAILIKDNPTSCFRPSGLDEAKGGNGVQAGQTGARHGRQAAPVDPVSECRPLEGVHVGCEHLLHQQHSAA